MCLASSNSLINCLHIRSFSRIIFTINSTGIFVTVMKKSLHVFVECNNHVKARKQVVEPGFYSVVIHIIASFLTVQATVKRYFCKSVKNKSQMCKLPKKVTQNLFVLMSIIGK